MGDKVRLEGTKIRNSKILWTGLGGTAELEGLFALEMQGARRRVSVKTPNPAKQDVMEVWVKMAAVPPKLGG